MQYLFELEIVNCVFTIILSHLIGPWSILEKNKTNLEIQSDSECLN